MYDHANTLDRIAMAVDVPAWDIIAIREVKDCPPLSTARGTTTEQPRRRRDCPRRLPVSGTHKKSGISLFAGVNREIPLIRTTDSFLPRGYRFKIYLKRFLK